MKIKIKKEDTEDNQKRQHPPGVSIDFCGLLCMALQTHRCSWTGGSKGVVEEKLGG